MTLLERLSGVVQHTSHSFSPKCRSRKAAAGTGPKALPARKQEHNTWVKLQTSGSVPSPRSGHDVAVVNNKVRLSLELLVGQQQ
jgi:hypothetical protein